MSPQPAARSDVPATNESLTAANSEEFASLLRTDSCDPAIGSFAADNGGRTIEFDGSVAAVANHGDTSTRYDILVAPGDKGSNATDGPSFKFEDVNIFDLGFPDAKIPGSIHLDDRFRFVARLAEYNQDQCLLFIEPVATRAR